MQRLLTGPFCLVQYHKGLRGIDGRLSGRPVTHGRRPVLPTPSHTARRPRSAGPLGSTYTNDLYGRRTAQITDAGSSTYTWDALGHLTSVVSEDTTITYAYGITGMREYKSVESAETSATWTKSVYDGQQLVAELDSSGTRYTYVWGPDRIPLALEVSVPGQASKTYAYHTDVGLTRFC